MSWRLFTDRGRQVWKYLADQPQEELPVYDPKVNPNSGDKVYRDLQRRPELKELSDAELDALVSKIQSEQDVGLGEEHASTLRTLLKGMHYYQSLQMEDGHWPGDYGGPMFLTPGAVITLYVTGCMDELLSVEHKKELIRYCWNHQSADGGWGLHIEEPCSMFGTVMTYVTLRLLGVPADEPKLRRAKNFIHGNGGAMALPSWGKFWLCVLGCYEWEGVNSLFPELWLTPEALPLHPSRWWCHCRMVYMPMAYIYGQKLVATPTPLILQLRQELYPMPYDSIDFSTHKDTIVASELYTPQTLTLKVLNKVSNLYEKFHSGWARKKACDFLLEYIHAEDEQTNYVDIGPVNKFINMLSVWHAEGPTSPKFGKHKDRVADYLWISEDGMKVNGYNGSQLWDTAFTIQAFVDTGLASYFAPALKLGYHYLEISQVMEDVKNRERFFRHISKGGWPFSTRDHGWPITDCTAEGLRATLALHDTVVNDPAQQLITAQRCKDAINVLLSFQNSDGGWATYENTRSYPFLEQINASEVFGAIMIDYSYVECTSATMQALIAFRQQHRFPDHRRAEIDQAVQRGVQFIKNKQREDGSWYGSWAVCFTYGTWFGVEGLMTAGESPSSPAIQKAVRFLLSKQRGDGGWSESYKACVTKKYVPREESQVVNTAWAALSLIAAKHHLVDPKPIAKAIRFLVSKQQGHGDWEQQAISGVFNGNCMISYTNYRNIFPLWAIGQWLQAQKEM